MNKKSNEKQRLLNEEMVEVIKEMKFSGKTPLIVLQQSILSTVEQHSANQAINALRLYKEEGKTIGFTKNDQARNNMDNYRDYLTPEVIDGFLNYVENQAIQRINSRQQNSNVNNLKPNNKGLYIVSDFHGDLNALNKVVDKINAGKKVIILGDATDRGNYGLEILEGIMDMQKMSGKRNIEYLPGNHDEFLYDALYNGMRSYETTGNIRFLQKYGINSCDTYLQNEICQRNGLTPTFQNLRELLLNNPQKVYELGRWLEEQPLLRIENDNGKRYALGHAAFDMDVFKKQFTLKDYVEAKTTNQELYEKMRLCLWYRDNSKENVQSARKYLRLPDEKEASNIIVGHTPNAIQVKLYGRNGKRNAVCVDSGRDKKHMYKYDSREDGMNVTKLHMPDER